MFWNATSNRRLIHAIILACIVAMGTNMGLVEDGGGLRPQLLVAC